MKIANRTDKKKIIELLAPAFRDVPGVQWITGNGTDHDRKLLILLDCCVEIGFHQGQIWLSDDETAVAVLFRQEDRRMDFFTFWQQMRLLFQVIGPWRAAEIMRRERYIRSYQQSLKKPALYVWFLASKAQRTSLDGIIELKNALFDRSEIEQRIVLMETTIQRVAQIYQRLGFEIYHHWQPAGRDHAVWFMMRKPHEISQLASNSSQKASIQTSLRPT